MDLANLAAFAVGPASLALLGYQSAKIAWLLKRLREGDFVHRGLGTVDLLPYALPIEDGIVLNKNGSLTASWLYTAADTGGLSIAEINEVASNANSALSKLSSGWMVQADLVRRNAPRYTPREACHFTDPVCASIDEERRRLFERLGAVYQGYTVLTLSYLPPRDVTKHFVRWLQAAPREHNATTAALTEFRATCEQSCEDLRARRVVTTLQRLGRYTDDDGITYDDQLRWLNFCTTGRDHPIRVDPAHPIPMDALVGTQDLCKRPSLRIGDNHIRCVSVDGFPDASHCTPTQLNLLTELPHEYRWSSRFIYLDPAQAQSELERTRAQWKGKTRSLRDQALKTNNDGTDHDAESMVASADAALNSLRAGYTANGYYTSTLVVMDPRRETADAVAAELLAAVNTTGFSGRIERENDMEAYLGSLPSDARNIRRPLLDTDALANLLPLTSLWCGSAKAPCSLYPPGAPNLMHTVTHGATPHWLNCHVGDVGHTLIFGPTRSGKSVLINTIMAQLRRYEGMKVFGFDAGLSMYALTRAIHATTDGRSGQHYRLGDDDGCPDLAPLQQLETRGDHEWAASWIQTVLELNGVHTTPNQSNVIAGALRDLAKTPTRSLSEFALLVQDDQIRAVLRQYTSVSGGLGAMFDARREELALSDFAVFEIKALMEADPRFAIPALLYLFRRIENSGSGPKAFVLDEGWLPLSHPVFSARAKKWFKTAAKENCAVILGTQGLTDIAAHGIFTTLNEQCHNKFYLPNKLALSSAESTSLYKSMGLTEHEVQRYIVDAEPSRHYYQSTPAGKRQFELELGPFALAFLAQTNTAAVDRIMALEKEHGHGWVDVWLEQRKQRFLAGAP